VLKLGLALVRRKKWVDVADDFVEKMVPAALSCKSRSGGGQTTEESESRSGSGIDDGSVRRTPGTRARTSPPAQTARMCSAHQIKVLTVRRKAGGGSKVGLGRWSK